MKSNSWGLPGLVAVLIYLLCGLAMLIWPDFMVNFAVYLFAGALCVFGIVLIINYWRSSAYEGALGYSLTLGLLTLLVGIVLICKPNILSTLLPFLWGLAMLVGGFGKVQMSVDLKRIGDNRWWILLIGAAVSLVLGVLCVLKPGAIATALAMFIGISLLVESVLDLVAILTLRKKIREAFPEGTGTVE